MLFRSKGGSLAWAWKLLDRHRRRESIDGNQMEIALAAIANVTVRTPLPAPNYEFGNEAAIRSKATLR